MRGGLVDVAAMLGTGGLLGVEAEVARPKEHEDERAGPEAAEAEQVDQPQRHVRQGKEE
eukprot:m.14913 g.14913  ORF g.14913 m.14913 type:complete len:59 (-) comp4844_c0_seq1:1794-1970(-)